MANTNAGVAAFAARYLGPQPNDPEAGAPRRISSNSGATLSRQVPGSFSNIVRHGEDLTGTLIQVQGQSLSLDIRGKRPLEAFAGLVTCPGQILECHCFL